MSQHSVAAMTTFGRELGGGVQQLQHQYHQQIRQEGRSGAAAYDKEFDVNLDFR